VTSEDPKTIRHVIIGVYEGIPDVVFIGTEDEARDFWIKEMKGVEEERFRRAERNNEEIDLSCDYDEDRTTQNSWDAGYFCDHNQEWYCRWWRE
jgi:hypothetical protein